jgi:ABC-type Fe3+ transport system permease subunit
VVTIESRKRVGGKRTVLQRQLSARAQQTYFYKGYGWMCLVTLCLVTLCVGMTRGALVYVVFVTGSREQVGCYTLVTTEQVTVRAMTNPSQ